jgi:hypothetical protein
MDLRTRNMKRKLDFTEQDDEPTNNSNRRRLDLPADISKRIHFLNSAFSSSDSDRSSARSAIFVLTEFAKDGTVFFFPRVRFDSIC